MSMSAQLCRLMISALVAMPLLLGAGCNKSSSGDEAITPSAKKEAEDIFSARCATCHGPLGHGDGPASAALTPKPRNFGDKAWQASITDAHIENIIQNGGMAVGKSPTMPPNPDLVAKPAVVKALRARVRSLAK
jgi:mono/diheme cytochrome c family protein